MIKIVIVDENIRFVSQLKKECTLHCPEFHIAGHVRSIKKAEKWIRQNSPDLIFLCSDYPDDAAFHLLSDFSTLEFSFVLMTRQETFPSKVYQFNVIDFLVLPLEVLDLLKVYNKFSQKKLYKDIQFNLSQMVSKVVNHSDSNINLAIPTLEGFVFMELENIVRLEASGAYTQIHSGRGEKIVSSRNIKEFEMQLPANQFCRVHNSHIVNVKRLHKYDKGRGGMLTLQDGTQILVSSRRKADFLKMFR